MNIAFDIIIVGSGPSGVSAAFPLVEAGLKVLMVDGGKKSKIELPKKSFLTERYESNEQWKWMIGKDFHALKNMDSASPKLRVPTHQYVFTDFLKKSCIESENFIAVGSLAKGGLSNAWGCGVAKLSAEELSDFPFSQSDIESSYEAVTQRIGVSGAIDDDLSDYYGLDLWSQPPTSMDKLHERMLAQYNSKKATLNNSGFRIGRSRIALLSQDLNGRKACRESGNCLWGCDSKSLYSSADEITVLTKYDNFHYQSSFQVDNVSTNSKSVSISGYKDQVHQTVCANKLLLAAGTLATTRLALLALKHEENINLQSCPTAAFLLWLPKMLGTKRGNNIGLGQLSFSLKLNSEVTTFGSTFSTTGIPMSEFVRHMPLLKKYSIDVLQHLLSSCVVGNIFLPGQLSQTNVKLGQDSSLKITGKYCNSVDSIMSEANKKLRQSYWKMGAVLLPKSFTQTKPGSDIHYSSTLPMRQHPVRGETDSYGEVFDLENIHIVDGSCLPTLSEKSHTLTIMANADRIGRHLVEFFKQN